MSKKKKFIITGIVLLILLPLIYFIVYTIAKKYYSKKFASNTFAKISAAINGSNNNSSSLSSTSSTPGKTSSNTTSSKKKSTSSTSTSSSDSSTSNGAATGTSSGISYWKPSIGNSFQIQFTETLDTSVEANVYDIDLFDNSSSVVSSLHSQGRKAVCYIDVGSWENWRDDANQFPSSVLGKVYEGYPDERWLDIRQIDTLAPIIGARLDLCKSKGFDGVEPDNINGYQNDTGFPLSAQDQLTYNEWLANQAHNRGLSIGLKNDTDQMNSLLSYFDWLVIEDCYDQGWCNDAKPFVSAGKPVFQIEYTENGTTTSQFCSQSISNSFYGILKHQSLDSWRQTCQ